jgi:hypothetical protein
VAGKRKQPRRRDDSPLSEVRDLETMEPQDQVEQTVPPPDDTKLADPYAPPPYVPPPPELEATREIPRPPLVEPEPTPNIGLPETSAGTAAVPERPLQLPDISLVQAVGVILWFCSQLIGMGLVDNRASKLALMAGATILVGVWLLADAIIRHGRSRALGVAPRPPVEPQTEHPRLRSGA